MTEEKCDRCKKALGEVGVHGILDGSLNSGIFCHDCYVKIYGPGRESMIGKGEEDNGGRSSLGQVPRHIGMQ